MGFLVTFHHIQSVCYEVTSVTLEFSSLTRLPVSLHLVRWEEASTFETFPDTVLVLYMLLFGFRIFKRDIL